MKRTPLKERFLPNYTKGEEKANMITHIVGGGLGIVFAVIAIIISAFSKNAFTIVSICIYAFTIVSLYAMSSIYHGLKKSTAKKVLQVIDHCTIYFFIAGTYTPILLVGIRPSHPVAAWVVFGVEWGCAFAAATLTAIDLKKYNILSLFCYICMGWCVMSILKATVAAISLKGFIWLLVGGVFYTVGAVLYCIGAKHKYFHTVFHLFVNIGSIFHAICIIKFVL